MKKNYILLFALAFIFPSIIIAQSDFPQQDTDYKFSYSTDEEGEGWAVYSYYLENVSNEKVYFYNFFFPDGTPDCEIKIPFPEDVLILDPGQKQLFIKVKTYTSGPKVNWVSNFLRYEDEGEHPLLNRDYIYFYEYSRSGNEIIYSYFLKNIGQKGVRFYDFFIVEENLSYLTYQDLPPSMLALRPGETAEYFKASVSGDALAPTTNWWAKFIEKDAEAEYSFEVTEYGFCEGIKSLLHSSKTDFENIRGPYITPAEDTFLGTEECYSKTHIAGINNEMLMNVLSRNYDGEIGEPSNLEEIKQRLEIYRAKVRECLPNSMTEKTVAEEDLYLRMAQIKFEGDFEGNSHYLDISIKEDYNEEDNYILQINIEAKYF